MEGKRFGLLDSAVASSADVWQEISDRLSRVRQSPTKLAVAATEVTAAVTRSVSEAQTVFEDALGRPQAPAGAESDEFQAPGGNRPGGPQAGDVAGGGRDVPQAPPGSTGTGDGATGKPAEPTSSKDATDRPRQDLDSANTSLPQPTGHETWRTRLGGLSRRVTGSRSRSGQAAPTNSPPTPDLLPPPPPAIGSPPSSSHQPPPPRADLPPPPGPLPPPPGTLPPPPPRKVPVGEASRTSGPDKADQ